jgi:hypothetical protein
VPLRSLLIQGHCDARGSTIPDWVSKSNGVENWAATLQSDWHELRHLTTAKVARYDLVLANLNSADVPGLCQLAESRTAHQKWVSLIEGDACDYLEPTNAMSRLLNASDLVITINERTVRYFQSITPTKCANIGIPYPVDYVKSLASPIGERVPGAFVCPRSNRKPSIAVAEALGLPVRVYIKHLSRQLKNVPAMLKHRSTAKDLFAQLYAKTAPSHVSLVERSQTEFWRVEGNTLLWVDLDPRFTWARFVIDAACLAVPVITTASTGHGERLFPQTTVPDVFCIDQAISIGRRLIADASFYKEVVEHAQSEVEAYRPENCKRQLLAELDLL